MVLNYHNSKRRIVSEGQQINGGQVMPAAEDMNELVWDCILEQEAQEAVAKCTDYAGNRGANEEVISSKPCNVTSGTRELLKKWWDEVVTAKPLTDKNKYDEQTVKHFGAMALHSSTVMACSYARCGSSTKLLCLYENAPAPNTALYKEGNMCADAACKCENKLCQTGPNYVNDPVDCNDDEMTNAMEQRAEYMHNYYRRVIATGWAKDPKSGYAPIASKMNYLTYDCKKLGAEMKVAIDVCAVPAAAAGQNVHVINDWKMARIDALEEAIKTWYKGLENGGGIGNDTTYTIEMQSNPMLRYYANMAYQESTKVGCSVQTCVQKGKTFVACKYDSQPLEGDPIYTIGRPCSKCSTNTGNNKCETNTDIKALCVA